MAKTPKHVVVARWEDEKHYVISAQTREDAVKEAQKLYRDEGRFIPARFTVEQSD